MSETQQPQDSSPNVEPAVPLASLDVDPGLHTPGLVSGAEQSTTTKSPAVAIASVDQKLKILRSNGVDVTPTLLRKMGAVNPVLPIPPFQPKKATKKDKQIKKNGRKASI